MPEISAENYMKNVPHNFEAEHEGPRAVLQGAQFLTRRAHPDWVYFLPILHFCACLMSTLRFFVPGLQYLSVMWDFVVRADVPVSLVVDASGPHYSVLAAIWVVVAGTLWWYLLSRLAEIPFRRFGNHRKAATN